MSYKPTHTSQALQEAAEDKPQLLVFRVRAVSRDDMNQVVHLNSLHHVRTLVEVMVTLEIKLGCLLVNKDQAPNSNSRHLNKLPHNNNRGPNPLSSNNNGHHPKE